MTNAPILLTTSSEIKEANKNDIIKLFSFTDTEIKENNIWKFHQKVVFINESNSPYKVVCQTCLSHYTTYSILPNGTLNNYGISNLIGHLKICKKSNNLEKFISSFLVKRECIKLNSIERIIYLIPSYFTS